MTTHWGENLNEVPFILLPDIVFLNAIEYYGGETEQAITFSDNKGNHYTSSDSYICSLDLQQLIAEYVEEKLDDKIITIPLVIQLN